MQAAFAPPHSRAAGSHPGSGCRSRRHAEVQDLAHDVGGHEIEHGAGEIVGELVANDLLVFRRRPVRGFERDQHLAIGTTDVVGRYEGEIEPARDADRAVDRAQLGGWNDFADTLLDPEHDGLGSLDPISAGGPHMQLDDADVGAREEVGTDHRRQGAGDGEQDGRAGEDEPAPRQDQFESAPVGVTDPVEQSIERGRDPRAEARGCSS